MRDILKKIETQEYIMKNISKLYSLSDLRFYEDLDDVIQSVYVDILEHSEKFDEDRSSANTYIYMLIKRVISNRLNYYKREKRDRGMIAVYLDDDINNVEFHNLIKDTSIRLEEIEIDEAVEKYLKFIRNENNRQAFILSLEGYSSKEVALIQNVGIECVRKRIRCAKNDIIKRLEYLKRMKKEI